MFPLQYTLPFKNWLLFSPIKDNHESRLREKKLTNVKNNKFCFLYTEVPISTSYTAYLHSHSLNIQSAPFTLRKYSVVSLTKSVLIWAFFFCMENNNELLICNLSPGVSPNCWCHIDLSLSTICYFNQSVVRQKCVWQSGAATLDHTRDAGDQASPVVNFITNKEEKHVCNYMDCKPSSMPWHQGLVSCLHCSMRTRSCLQAFKGGGVGRRK